MFHFSTLYHFAYFLSKRKFNIAVCFDLGLSHLESRTTMETNGKSSAGDCVKVSVEVPKYTIAERKREIQDLLTKNHVQDGQKKLNNR